MRAQLLLVWDSMCAVAWALAASRRASAHAAAPGSSREQRAEQPEGARPEGAPGHAGHAGHAGVRTSFRTTTAPSSTIPYMHTINGPVGRSPASDSHRPRIEASAPEPHEM